MLITGQRQRYSSCLVPRMLSKCLLVVLFGMEICCLQQYDTLKNSLEWCFLPTLKELCISKPVMHSGTGHFGLTRYDCFAIEALFNILMARLGTSGCPFGGHAAGDTSTKLGRRVSAAFIAI